MRGRRVTAPPTHGDRRQSGVALVVALVLLTAITIIGTSAMNAATLQIVMAGNVTAYDLAFRRPRPASTSPSPGAASAWNRQAPSP